MVLNHSSNIVNMDETGFNTVQQPVTVVATKGERSVGKAIIGERCHNVIALCAMTAGGSYPNVYFSEKTFAREFNGWNTTWVCWRA